MLKGALYIKGQAIDWRSRKDDQKHTLEYIDPMRWKKGETDTKEEWLEQCVRKHRTKPVNILVIFKYPSIFRDITFSIKMCAHYEAFHLQFTTIDVFSCLILSKRFSLIHIILLSLCLSLIHRSIYIYDIYGIFKFEIVCILYIFIFPSSSFCV